MSQTESSALHGNRRRSQRVIARIRVKAIRRESGQPVLSEDTHTIVVNAHGALVTLAMTVRPGETLALKNFMSSEETPIRIIRVGEKQAPPREVAVEFTSPAPHFWHIDFPPADWKLVRD